MVSVSLTESLDGESSITSTAGIVNLSFSRSPNLKVSATTSQGDIKSLFPLEINRIGQISQAFHTFGAGESQLKVEGTGSTIIFTKAE